MQRMNSLRRSLRDSFRRKRDAPESSKPHQWQADEEAVRSGICSFHVKYLGCVEVFESRGMQVCEEAMKVLRQSRRRPVKSTLFVSGDGLRVVEDDTKGLIVDQTIEKVSFCAPDRNHERGFSYICRDGTTRRWMCHGFLASKESGERLSHAVGCAFASCLERKQKREKECGVTMTYDSKTSTFTRSGSFRVPSLTESSGNKSTSPPMGVDLAGQAVKSASITTAAIERPHAPAKMLERQGSFRGFSQLANRSPFKRQLSLRLNDLPSNLQRTQPQPTNVDILTNNNIVIPPPVPSAPATASASPAPPPRTQRNRFHSLPNNTFSGIPASSSSSAIAPAVSSVLSKFEQNKDLVTELCQQVTQGLSLLAANHDEPKAKTDSTSAFPTKFTNPWDEEVETPFGSKSFENISNASNSVNAAVPPRVPPIQDDWVSSIANNLAQNQAPKPVMEKVTNTSTTDKMFGTRTAPSVTQVAVAGKTDSDISTRPPPPPVHRDPIKEAEALWNSSSSTANGGKDLPPIPPHPHGNVLSSRPPLVSSGSVAHPIPGQMRPGALRGPGSRSHSLGADPFDADWASNVARTGQTPTNPFARQQTFQISM